MTLPPERQAAPEQARRLVDDATSIPEGMAGPPARELAWALKDLCYASWNSDPARAVRAARALSALSAAVRGDPGEIAALADWTAGIALLTEGGMAEALACFDRAAARFTALGADGPAAQTQVPSIVALSMLGRHDEAVHCAQAAQQAFIALGDRQSAGRVSVNLGTLHWRRGDYAEAARHSRAAVLLFARVGDREHSVMADIGLADALTALGDHDEALRIYARARMRASAHGLPVLEAIAVESVALLDMARGHFREALAGLERARHRYERLGMAQQLAVAEKQLGDTYLELHLLPEALALFDEAWRRFEALELPDEQAWTLVQRGRALALLSRRELAADALQDAARLFTAQGNTVGLAAVALARAELALGKEDGAAALVLAQQASDGFAAAGQAERSARADACRARALLHLGQFAEAHHSYAATLSRARALGLLSVQLPCLTGLGRCARAEGRTDAAREAFAEAIDLFEAQSSVLPGDELRSAYLGDHLEPYRELLRMALDAHACSPGPGTAAAAWRRLESFRARALGDRVAGRVRVEASEATQALRAQIHWLYRRIERLQDDGESAAPLVEAMHRAERELLELARRERLAKPPVIASTADDDAPASGAWLAEGDALVEYGVQDDELFAFVVTPADVRLVRGLASWREVQQAAESLRFQIETLRHGAAPVQAHLARLAERAQSRLARLHALLWAPLAGPLRGVQQVLIVPHGVLASIPFAALHDGAACLGEYHRLALAPSARVAQRMLAAQPRPARSALVLGATHGLPHADREARLVAGLFAEAATCIDEQATLDALRRLGPRADVIHFASHAQFRSDNPMFSALHLHDGTLTVEAAEALTLNAGIVVLSACETGLAAQGGGDEMFGLVRAFFVAGTARVLASLWPVDDEVTAAFMEQFYRALCAGARPAGALQTAQCHVRARHPHPFYWAAFVLYGGF